LNDLQILGLQANSRACAIDGGIASPKQQQRLRCNLKLKDPLHYPKSGAIVMNLDAWRLRQIHANVLNIAQDNHDVLEPMDQDALTMALAGG
jgi:lipopolysaccharide biosynthesis glycosyltransferase